jgi:predicted adenylyl cyclase CyaB
MHYEVERRANVNLKNRLPKEAKLERIYGGTDTYFKLDPFLRVRDLILTYPSKKPIQKMGLKKIVDGEIREIETTVNAANTLKILQETMGQPIVRVEVDREEYSLGDLRICVDNVKNLKNKDWTEVEKITHSKEENPKALEEIEKTFESMGIKREQLVNDIYPTLIFKEQNCK